MMVPTVPPSCNVSDGMEKGCTSEVPTSGYDDVHFCDITWKVGDDPRACYRRRGKATQKKLEYCGQMHHDLPRHGHLIQHKH